MHFKPKKSLGQNFLIDKNIQKKIISACLLSSADTVLEIGPGRGELTSLLVDKVKKIYAVELDNGLYSFLKERFKDQSNLRLANEDILKYNLKKKLIKEKNIKVIGNLPYYISTPIIEHLFQFRDKIQEMFFMVQKEFAYRIVASAGSKRYGSLSCFIQYYTEPKINFLVKKGSFLPQPKVDSAFISLRVRKRPKVEVEDENRLFKVIRTAFSQRRKTLKNSLKGLIPQDTLEPFFIKKK
jgi:16S rRNA (adenine1518-N6/adenine1519-N6)-dimethyltransferase